MAERDDRDAAGAARSRNVVHYIERDDDDAAHMVASLTSRRDDATSPTFVAILPGPDQALAFCTALGRLPSRAGSVVPVTSVGRGRRLLQAGATAIAGAPAQLAPLVAESRLSLANVQALAFVWPEDIVTDDTARGLLESVIAEAPRTAERVAVCASRPPELSQFLERAMWKARAIDHTTGSSAPATTGSLRVLVAPRGEMLFALRSLLDAFDPPRATIFAFGDSVGDATAAVEALSGTTSLLRVSTTAPVEREPFGVLLGPLPEASELTALSSMVDELIAIIPPALLPQLRRMTPSVAPMPWTGSLGNARSYHDALRDEVRGSVTAGAHLPWMLVVEPLLEDLDAVEVAAAALAVVDRERRKSKRAATVPVQAAPAPERPAREGRPRPTASGERRGPRDDRRDDRPTRGFGKRPFSRDARGSDERRPPRDAPRGGGRREDRDRDIERVPRAAREREEWSQRGDRLRNSRRGTGRRDRE